MKCLALGYYKEGKIAWDIANKNPFYFFDFDLGSELKKFDNDLKLLCANLPSNPFCATFHGYFFHILEIQGNCCMAICDDNLSALELYNLTLWVLFSTSSLAENNTAFNKCVAQEPSLNDPRIDALRAELTELVEKILPKVMESLGQREEELSKLKVKAETLKVDAIKFRKGTEEMNSCWPQCHIF